MESLLEFIAKKAQRKPFKAARDIVSFVTEKLKERGILL